MKHTVWIPLLCSIVSVASAQPGGSTSGTTEMDFLGDMPIVLSVSRLAQRLDETPGAVTILDRNFIRQSGARDVADLLRVVPGFQTTTSFETDAPMATYHGRTDEWANRIQVLVDGRSIELLGTGAQRNDLRPGLALQLKGFKLPMQSYVLQAV